MKISLVEKDVEEDVEDNLDNIMVPLVKKSIKKIDGKKIPLNIHMLDNISFHYEESVLKWNYMYHRRIAPKREMSKEALKCEEIVELLEDAQVMKIVACLIPL